MSTLLCQIGGDAWLGAIDDDGGAVAFGGGGIPAEGIPPRIGAVSLSTGEIFDFGEGRNARFVRPGVVTWQHELTPTSALRMEGDLASGRVVATRDDVTLASGNEFDASNGSWSARLDATRRLTLNNEIVGYGYRGARMAGAYLVSVKDDRWFEMRHRGALVRTHDQPARANEWSISSEGWIGYGYFWDARIILPDGRDLDVTVTPWRREGVPQIVHLPNGETWIWTATERGAATFAIGRPAHVPAEPGVTPCIQVAMPSRGLRVAWDGSRFIIAGNTDQGELAVYAVASDEARAPVRDDVQPPAPPPPPPPPKDPTMMKIHVDDYARTGRVGERARIDFRLESDVPVREVRIDFVGDGHDGVTLRGDDLRDLAGVVLRPKRAGSLGWDVSAVNVVGEPDRTGTHRPIEVRS